VIQKKAKPNLRLRKLLEHLDFLEWKRRPKHTGQKTAFVAEELDLVDVRGGLKNRTYRLTDAGVQMRDEV